MNINSMITFHDDLAQDLFDTEWSYNSDPEAVWQDMLHEGLMDLCQELYPDQAETDSWTEYCEFLKTA
jgi:hypothetical protein